MAQTQAGRSAYHGLPPGYVKAQESTFVLLMTLVSAVLFATMLNWGFDPGIPDWGDLVVSVPWIIEHAVMTGAGFVMGGMALRTSITMAVSFRRGEFISGTINLIGAVLFGGPEVWASLVARAHNFPLADADKWLLMSLGFAVASSISPTLIIIAALPPLAGFFFGISQPVTEDETAEEIQRKADLKTARILANAKIRDARVQGYVKTASAATKQIVNQVKGAEEVQPLDPEEDGASSGETEAVSPRNRDRSNSGGSAPSGLPKGYWSWVQFSAFLKSTYGQDMDREKASGILKTIGKETRAEGVQGHPFIAHAKTCRSWASNQPFAKAIRLVAPPSSTEQERQAVNE